MRGSQDVSTAKIFTMVIVALVAGIFVAQVLGAPLGNGNGYGYGYGYGYGTSGAPSPGGGSGGQTTTDPASETGSETQSNTPTEESSSTSASTSATGSGEPSTSLVFGPGTSWSAFFNSIHPDLEIEIPGRLSADAEVQGEVTIRYIGPSPPADLRFVLWTPDGPVEVLAEGVSEFTWDTSRIPNGIYTIMLTQGTSDIAPAQSDGLALAQQPIAVRNPENTPGQAWGSVLVGGAIAGLGGIIASRASVFFELGKEGAIAYGEDQLKETTERVKVRGSQRPNPLYRAVNAISRFLASFASLQALILTVLLLTAFFSIEGMESNTLAGFMDALPIVGLAAVIFGLGAVGLEVLVAKATGSGTKLRLYGPGILSLAVSATVFRSAFGYPSYVDELAADGESDELAPRVEGIRAMAVLSSVLVALPIFILLGLWRFDLMEEGLVVTVAGLAGAAMPIAPLPGHDIWRWSKLASVAIFIASIAMFLSLHLAWLPLRYNFWIGLVGAAAYAAMAWWLWNNLRTEKSLAN